MKIKLLCAIGALTLSTLTFGQNPIPNPSFEDWTSMDPEWWFTSNSPGGLNVNVTKTSPGHTGEFAAKGEVTVWANTPGFPFIPILESRVNEFGFPLTERHASLSLQYKFHKAGPDDSFTIFVGVLDEEGNVFGGGFVDVTEETEEFTLLEILLSYSAEVEPHRAYVSMTINNNTGELQTIGSYFIVDDLAMGDPVASAADEANHTGLSLRNIYPNPAADELAIAFSLAQMSQVDIGIYDLSGKLVSTVFAGKLPDGDHSIPANVHDLPNGFYLCRLTTEAGLLTQKLLVSKG